MDTTVVVAWWGAVVATLVLAWDIYKYRKRSGPRVHLEVKSGMEIVNSPDHEGNTYVTVRAYNRGDQATTVTNLATQWYKTWFHVLFRRPEAQMIIARAGITHHPPYRIEPGDLWDGFMRQDQLDKYRGRGVLFCRAYFSHTGKPVSKRIKL